jgi:ribosomal protein L11 methyltransferase
MNYFQIRFILKPLLPAREVLLAELSEKGFESFTEEEDGPMAYIPERDFSEALLTDLMTAQIPDLVMTQEVKLIPAENWNAAWESGFTPIFVDDRCCIRAPFHSVQGDFEFDIIIEPKMSFGTGHHDTTHLIISRLMQSEVERKTVLDMGCGTGVLAILASKMGAKGGDAIDIDEWAFENTKENFERNGCTSLSVLMGGAEVIPQTATYDLILANINRNILTRDMHHYAKVLAPGGKILFSGFYESDFLEIDVCASRMDLIFNHKEVRNEWCMLEYRKAN